MKSKSQLLLLIPVIALAAAVGGAYWFILRPDASDNTLAANHANGPQVPDLGGRGRPIELSNMEVPADDGVATDGAATDDSGEVEPEPEVANSAREIDTWLSNLAIATKAGDRRGISLNHEMLAKAKPDTLVDERVRFALDNEESAWVRIQFFAAYHEAKPRFDWAMHVYDTRTAKFMGTDDLYVGGEVDELEQIAAALFGRLIDSWRNEGTGDIRLLGLVQDGLLHENPPWLVDAAMQIVVGGIIRDKIAALAIVLREDFRLFLQRRTAERGHREGVLFAYILAFDPVEAILDDLGREEWWDYASALLLMCDTRPFIMISTPQTEWLVDFCKRPEIAKLYERLLSEPMPLEEKRLLIQRLGTFVVANGRMMIESGLARHDANYADYLAAFGMVAHSTADLQRLTAAADEPDVAAAQGAIEGLRQSSLPEADNELRKVIDEGTNLGVKSQALGALLSRAEKTDKLLDEYLDESKDASLRAVAVQHVPLTDLERLQRIVEEDSSPSVRLAALNRVGSITPTSVIQRKELYAWFIKIKGRDNSSTIRAAARKYAEVLQE